ncbi:MAG: hypothetical protein K5840_01870 [Eubacterium sp.]|nr:hypothetical protein [Eubacterium sp.]
MSLQYLQNYFEGFQVPVFPLAIIIITGALILRFKVRKIDKTDRETAQEFWIRESEANATRAVDVSTLEYLEVPCDELPLHATVTDENPAGDEDAEECARIIEAIAEKKVKNLTGLTNTDLKLQYGAANLDFLSRCDENFTILTTTLNRLALRLDDLGYTGEAKTLAEYAVETGSDIKQTYLLLGKYYREADDQFRFQQLKYNAENLNSLMKDSIIRELEES